MRILFLLSVLFFSAGAMAQINYRITYGIDMYGSITFNHEPVIKKVKSMLVFNDTMSYWYILAGNKDVFKKKGVYGNKLFGHSRYYRTNSGLIEEGVAKRKTGKGYLVFDSIKLNNWVLFNESKKVCGFTCFEALSVDANNDSTLVYYTKDLLHPFGPSGNNGLPGVILEVYDQKYHWHITATKVEQGHYVIEYPKMYTWISKDSFLSESNIIYGKRNE